MRHKGGLMERKIRLKTVNPHITCSLCKGYLVEATTITECLHTFCKSCIVKYLETHVCCPQCNLVIHQSHPLNYISHDRTMQDIVYKLVPNLQEGELKLQQEFYRSRGLPMPRASSATEEMVGETNDVAPQQRSEDQDHDCHRNDEQVNICLECNGSQLKMLKRRFLRCSSHTTITHLKKFVSLKLFSTSDKFKDVDILCNNEILGKDHTLKFICVTRWRVKDPLKLHYRPRVTL